MHERRIAYYLSVGIALASLAVGIVTLNPAAISVASLFAAVSLAIYGFWDIIESLIYRRTSASMPIGGYELSGRRDSAVRYRNGRYLAVSVAELKPLREGRVGIEELEGIISRLSTPFTFTVAVERLDRLKIINGLKTRRAMKELELSRMEPHQKAAALRREIEQIEIDISAVESLPAPLSLSYYLAVSSLSRERTIAERLSAENLRLLSGAFDAAGGFSSSVVVGNELARLLNAEKNMVLA